MLYAFLFFLLVFIVNVVLGSTGAGAFVDVVGEMLLLAAAAIAFAVAVLQREARDKKNAE